MIQPLIDHMLLLKYYYLHLHIRTHAYQYTFFFSDLLCMLCVERHKNNVFEIYTLKIHVH